MVLTPLAKLLALLFAAGFLHAQSLPVVPMQMGPEELAKSLRERPAAISADDCDALNLLECRPDFFPPAQPADVCLRWIQLDDDPELEATLVVEAKAEWTYMAYIFDKQSVWMMVGSLSCYRTCDANSLIRVQQLTQDSPSLLLYHRDLGGSAQVLMTTTGYQLRGGKLWQAFEISNYDAVFLAAYKSHSRRVLSAGNRLVVHTITEQPLGRIVGNDCEVRKWDAKQFTFVLVSGERAQYCDSKTGKPILQKSFATGLPVYP